jgi:hypothetical protein
MITVKKKFVPPCGNAECGASTGICESITAGTGELSDYGYWEFPCLVCPPVFEELLKEGKIVVMPGAG